MGFTSLKLAVAMAVSWEELFLSVASPRLLLKNNKGTESIVQEYIQRGCLPKDYTGLIAYLSAAEALANGADITANNINKIAGLDVSAALNNLIKNGVIRPVERTVEIADQQYKINEMPEARRSELITELRNIGKGEPIRLGKLYDFMGQGLIERVDPNAKQLL